MGVERQVERVEAKLRSGDTVTIPVWLLDSGRSGPCLLLTAAQHGNEVQGTEAIRGFVGLCEDGLCCGKVVAIPMVNLPAIRQRRPHINMKPEQPYGDSRGHNMNRHWPGKSSRNATARIPAAIYRAYGPQATHALDLHCWEKHAAPAVLIRDLPAVRDLAAELGHRFVDVRPPADFTLGGHFCATGRIGVTYEFAGQYTVNESEVRRGLRMMTNFAKAIGMLPGDPDSGDVPVLFSDQCATTNVTAPCSGLFVEAGLKLCAPVCEGDVLGTILSDVDLSCREVRSPVNGYLRAYGASRANCDVAMPGHHPYVTEGERLARVQAGK